jgi:hypothetical protein
MSELTPVTPAGALRSGRASWATVVAIGIVAEAGLLWLAAGLTMWRRRRALEERPGKRQPIWLGLPRFRR